MTTIPPSVPIPLAVLAGGADITALLTQLPPDLQSAGRGTVISGTVIAVDPQGQVALQTSAGIVGFQGVVSVSVGQQVTLQVQSTAGGQVRAMVLAAEAKAMDEIASAGAAAQAPDAAAAEAAMPAATVAPSVASGSVIVATVIASAPGGPSTAPAVSSASIGAGAAALTPALAQVTPAASRPTSSPVPSTASPAATSSAATASPPAAASPAAPAGGSGGATAPQPSSPAPRGAPSAPPAATSAPTRQSVPPAPAALAAPASPPAPLQPPSPAAGAALPPRAVSAAIASYAASATANTTTATGAPPASTTAAPLPTPPPGTLVPLRLVGPLASLAAAAAGAASGQVVATVVARTPAGQMIVDTAIGRLAFAAPATDEAPVGSQIAFEIAAPALRPGAAAAGSPPLAPGRGLAGLTAEWPSLKDAISTLTATDPALARQVVETVIPQLGNPRFVAQILAFLATTVDDANAILGQAAVDALLQTGHGDVLARLQGDINDMSRLNASATDWQVFYLPLLDPTQIRQLRVYTRRRKAGTGWQRDSGRFVVEFEFETLGPLQLDGLVQKPRLDLILRSHGELPGALRSGISEVFAGTCAAAGLSGKLVFQAQPSFPVSPFEEMSRSPASGVSV
ncbi:MAG: hypothetical protein JO128_20800 [Alphaproteobacteria bacterium]|nr:hypothetical protein [Alphaproteobacteria bacterium]